MKKETCDGVKIYATRKRDRILIFNSGYSFKILECKSAYYPYAYLDYEFNKNREYNNTSRKTNSRVLKVNNNVKNFHKLTDSLHYTSISISDNLIINIKKNNY